MNQLNYFIYCRKSSEEDTKQIQSLDTQQRILLDLANTQKLNIVDIIKESKSAKTDQNRPLFTHMLERIANGEANAILVVHTDRLARNMIEAGFVIKLLEAGTLKEVRTPNTVYNSAPSLLYMGFDFVFAAHYSRDLSVKVKAGNESKLLKGEYPTYAPIGYINIQPGRGIKPDPIRAKHITNAFNYYATGEYSVKTLAKKMFEETFRSRLGNRVSDSTLHRILTNPEYYGVIERKGIYYTGKHVPLISQATFDIVQEILAGRSRPRKQTKQFTYRDYLLCGKCGCKITASICKGKYIYYRCTNGKGNCEQHKKYLSEEDVKKLLAQYCKTFTLDPERANLSFNMYKQSKLKEANSSVVNKTELTNLIDALDRKLERLEDMRLDDQISSERFSARRVSLLNERTQLMVVLQNHQSVSTNDTLELVEELKNQACSLSGIFENGDDAVRRDLIKSLLWNCDISDGKLVATRLTKLWEPLKDLNKTTDLEKWRRRWDLNPRTGKPVQVSNLLQLATMRRLQSI